MAGPASLLPLARGYVTIAAEIKISLLSSVANQVNSIIQRLGAKVAEPG
jgi:hypothetical protein